MDASSRFLGQGVPTAIGMALGEKLMSKSYPTLINHFTYALCGGGDMQDREVNGDLAVDFSELEKRFVPGYVNATRNISQEILSVIVNQLPNFYSGAADLTTSTKTVLKDKRRNIAFGIREFAMVAIINGVNLHGASR